MNPLPKRELLLSLKHSTIEASFSVPMLTLTLSHLPFAIGFAVKVLGWGAPGVGLMAAMPYISFLVQPLFSWLLQRRFSLHSIVVMMFTLNALPWTFIYFFPWIGKWKDEVFIVVTFISCLGNAICAVAWSAAMSSLVPMSIRGKFFGRRTLIYTFWTLVIVLAAGQVVDHFHNSLRIFGIVFLVAAILRLIGLLFFIRMKFPATVTALQSEQVTLRDYFSVFRDWNYMALVLFIGVWGFFLNMGTPFYNVYALRELPLTVGDLTILATIANLGGLISMRTWGGLCDRFGNKPVLFTCALLWAGTAMVSWLFTSPTHYWHQYVNYFITGFMTAGFQLCQFNLMIKLVPTRTKSHYISVFYAVTSFFTAIGPLLGGKILGWLPNEMGSLLGQPLLSYHVMFFGSLFFCFLTVHLLSLVQEPAERPWRELVRVMRQMREFNPVFGLMSVAQFMMTPGQLVRFLKSSARTLKNLPKDAFPDEK